MVSPRQSHRPPLRLPLEAYTPVTDATYTAKAGDRIIGINRAGVVTITLPTAEVRAGRLFTIKDESGNAFVNNITIATEGSETIDGSTTKVIDEDYGAKHFYSDGSNWFTIPRISQSAEDTISRQQWNDLNNFSSAGQVVTGTGSTIRDIRRFKADTGATASSTALTRTKTFSGWNKGNSNGVLDWSKRVVIQFPFTIDQNTTNGIARFTFGKGTADGMGALVDKGIGIHVDNLAIKGIVHNGSSGATIDLSTTLTTAQVYLITMVSDGSGNIEWFINDVSKGTSAAGPTGDAGNGEDSLQIEALNGADSADQAASVYFVKIFVDQ